MFNVKIRNRFAKLFLSIVLLILPVFLVYLFMTQSILMTLKNETNAATMTRLAQISDDISQRYKAYSDTSAQISTRSELLRYNMLKSEISASKGIQTLQDIRSYDAAVKDLFMNFGNDDVYSAAGLTDRQVYFSNRLLCTEESANRAVKVLMDTESGLHLLAQDSGLGYLLFHYPVRWNTENAAVSVNYLMTVSTLANMLEPLLMNSDTFVSVVFASGGKLTFFGNTGKDFAYINESDILADMSGYTMHSVASAATGLTISSYYKSSELYKDVNRRQIYCYAVIFLLLLLTVLLSFVISRRYNYPIRQLASQIARQREVKPAAREKTWSNTDELDYLKETFLAMTFESDRLSQDLEGYKAAFRPQAALMIFNGVIKDAALIDKMLELCDFEIHEDYFSILGILVQDDDEQANLSVYAALQLHFKDELSCLVSIADKKVLAVLLEMPNPDYSCRNRLTIEENIRRIGQSCPEKMLISFSMVHKDVTKVSQAYTEAAGSIEYALNTERTDSKTIFFEKLIKENPSAKPLGEAEMIPMVNALQAYDEKEAIRCFGRLTYDIEYGQFSNEMKRYQRSCIQQKIIQIINSRTAEASGVKMLSEAMQIDPADYNRFDSAICNLIQQACFTEKNDDVIKKAMAYIDKNFCKYDLTLDEVADSVSLSKYYLSKLFKVKTGKRYIDYLSEIRLEESKRLLTSTKLSIQEIVRRVGYYDVPRFRKKFKEMYGVNAAQFRKVI